MADVFKFKDEFGNVNLVCDATPDAPRFVNSNSVYDRPNLSQDQQQKNEQQTSTPFINNNESSASNSTSDKSDKSKSNDKKSSKSKKKSTSSFSFNIINSQNVKIGPTVVHNLNNYQNFDHKSCCRTKEQDKEEMKQMLPHIQALSKSKQVVTKEDILLIKTHLGSSWKKVAKKIGFSKGEIDQFLEDYKHKGIGEVIYQLLIVWKNSQTDNATIGHLVNAMWTSDEYECVEKLAMAHNIED